MAAKSKQTSSEPTLYEALEMPPGSLAEELHERYKALARKWHPDMPQGNHDTFCAVTEAGSILLDPERRRAYDALLRLTRTPCYKCDGDGRRFIQMSFTVRVSRRCEACRGVGYASL